MNLNRYLRVDILCKSLSNNPCYMLTITNNIKTYLGSQDEAILLKKSNAARSMMKRKMQRIEALQQNVKSQKDSISNSIPNNINVNTQNIKRDTSNNVTKKKKTKDEQDGNNSDSSQKNLFTEKHFTPNKHFANYINDHKHKKGIVITCRVHPGESNASFIAEGIISFLLGNSREANFLRNNFIIKILPMINPDGVIYGNYRCSLLGVDLNRRWNNPSKILHPTIYNAKQLIKMLDIERGVSFFCDIHGHSRK